MKGLEKMENKNREVYIERIEKYIEKLSLKSLVRAFNFVNYLLIRD